MNIEYERLLKNKDLIINSISSRGPSLPVHLAKIANISTLFASAYLSELYAEKKVLMSHLKVGSTSLYFLPGQEPQLENFIQYLNQKEQEAFHLLKKKKVLSDTNLEPAIRVAMHEIKDFANPLNIDINDGQRLFWKYFLISDEEAKNLILKPQRQEKKESLKTAEQGHLPESTGKVVEEIPLPKEKKQRKKKSLSTQELKFSQNMKEYLTSKEIEILEVKEEKKKDFVAKIRIDSLFGKQEYLLIAKDKKKISEEDVFIALQKAQSEKALALIMSKGELDKTALPHMKEWRNLIKFEKIKF